MTNTKRRDFLKISSATAAMLASGGHMPGAKFIEWKNVTDFEKKI